MRKRDNNTEGAPIEDAKKSQAHKKKVLKAKKFVVDRFMTQYDTLMSTIIRKNNDDIYTKLKEFL
jgi:hypothetical protein